jgi:hypothetical protein
MSGLATDRRQSTAKKQHWSQQVDKSPATANPSPPFYHLPQCDPSIPPSYGWISPSSPPPSTLFGASNSHPFAPHNAIANHSPAPMDASLIFRSAHRPPPIISTLRFSRPFLGSVMKSFGLLPSNRINSPNVFLVKEVVHLGDVRFS